MSNEVARVELRRQSGDPVDGFDRIVRPDGTRWGEARRPAIRIAGAIG
ncbi:hypothetical protein [Bradyrhizobium sp. USDA 4353]